MTEPATPLEAYKAIIDRLVNETRIYGSGSTVVNLGVFSKAPAHAAFNKFIGSLSPEQRDLVSQMLRAERDNTIHDVLADLSWWIDIHEVGLTFHSEPMPVDLSGGGLHGDFVGRREGWEWPDEGS